MWSPVKIWGKNVGALATFEHIFENGCTVVQGINLDDKGQKSNGSGKSTFVDIVPIALTGSSFAGKASIKHAVAWDKNVMKVGIELHNYHIDETMWIEREVFSDNKSENLFIKVNGTFPETVPNKKGVYGAFDIKIGNQFIIDKLGVSKEHLEQRYLISQSRYSSFFEITAGKKMKLVEQFADTQKIDRAIESLQLKIADKLKPESNNINVEIAKIQGRIDHVDQSIDDIESGNEAKKHEENKRIKVAALSEDLIKIKQKHEKTVIDVRNTLSEWKYANEKIEHFEKEERKLEEEYHHFSDDYNKLLALIWDKEHDLTHLKNELDKHRDKARDFKSKLMKVDAVREQIKLELKKYIVCPNCEHTFIVGNDKSLQQSKSELKEANDQFKSIDFEYRKICSSGTEQSKRISNLEVQKAQWKNEHQKLILNANALKKEHYRKFTEAGSILSEAKKNVEAIRDRHHRIKIDCDRLKAMVEEKSMAIDQIKKEKYEPLLLSSLIKESQNYWTIISGLEKNRKKVDQEIALYDQWTKNYEDFKFTLINKRIQSIAQRMNYYLEQNGSDLTVTIEGFKQNRDGSFRQQFTPMISRNGANPQIYSQFSGGERVRLNLAGDLAFQEIINSQSDIGGLNYYQNDEVLNSADDLGIENAAKAFDHIGKPMMLVTHSGSDIVYRRKIVVTKQNGISLIK